MDAYSLYKIASEYAEKVWLERGDYVSTYYATITVLESDDGHIYTGITGIFVNYGDVEILRSEKAALSAMALDGQTYAKQMVTLSFKTRKAAAVNEEQLKLLYEVDHRNANCLILTSAEETTTVGDVIGVKYDPAEEEPVQTEQAAAEEAAEETPVAEPEAAEEVAEETAVEESEAVEEVPEEPAIEESEAAEEESAEENAEESAEETVVEESATAEEEPDEETAVEESETAEEETTEETAEEPAAEEPAVEETEAAEEEVAGETAEEEPADETAVEEAETAEEESAEEAPEESAAETHKLDEENAPDFMAGFDFGDDAAPTSEIVVPKVQKNYEKYDKRNTAKRVEKEFSDGVTIDSDNPFFDAGSTEQKEVVAFADKDAVKNQAEEESAPQQPTMSKKEMLKMAKKRKKIAKNNNRYR